MLSLKTSCQDFLLPCLVVWQYREDAEDVVPPRIAYDLKHDSFTTMEISFYFF